MRYEEFTRGPNTTNWIEFGHLEYVMVFFYKDFHLLASSARVHLNMITDLQNQTFYINTLKAFFKSILLKNRLNYDQGQS